MRRSEWPPFIGAAMRMRDMRDLLFFLSRFVLFYPNVGYSRGARRSAMGLGELLEGNKS